jgi:hypothetical protein
MITTIKNLNTINTVGLQAKNLWSRGVTLPVPTDARILIISKIIDTQANIIENWQYMEPNAIMNRLKTKRPTSYISLLPRPRLAPAQFDTSAAGITLS